MNNISELQELVYINQDDFGCNKTGECLYLERSLSYALGVEIPTPTQDPEEVFKECCYTHFVFADANSSQDFKNDYSSFYHQRQLSNETVDFILYHFEEDQEYPISDGTFGEYFGFGFFNENTDLKGCLIKWKKVLVQIGEGSFKIIKRINIAGIDVEFSSIVFTLKQFSSGLANQTARIDVVMNGRLEKSKVDFTGIGWKNSMRVPGFFGRREFQFEEDNIVNRQFESRQVSMQQTNEYKFQTNLIPDCVTNEIIDFLLFGNDIFVNDYNLNNHSYTFVKFPVKFESNEGTEYGVKTRRARLNLVFSDKFKNNLKRNFK